MHTDGCVISYSDATYPAALLYYTFPYMTTGWVNHLHACEDTVSDHPHHVVKMSIPHGDLEAMIERVIRGELLKE